MSKKIGGETMAKIENVDYERIPGQASQMRSEGQALNKELKSAYESINLMRNFWYGQRYDSLVKEFNRIVPDINELLTLVVSEFPYALEIIANNYSQADKGANVTSPQNTAPDKIEEILLSTGIGLRFISTQVEMTQTQVEKNFDNAKEKMNSIESIYNQIQWESEASQAFKAKFTKLKSQIISSFENIKSQFAKLMTQAQQDVQSAETSNTVM